MLILSLIILQLLPTSFCYDVELQGKLKVGYKYLTALRQPSDLVNLVLSFLPKKIVGKGKLPKALDTIAIPYLKTSNNIHNASLTQIDNRLADSPKELQDASSNLEEFMNHLQITGRDTIYNISTEIVADLDIEKDITPILKIVTSDYTSMLQNYYDYVKKSQNDADRDLLYLDMVETSCRLLFEGQKKLLNDILMHDENHNRHGRFKKITRELLKRSYVYKRATMSYVCKTYQVCKEYPAISDYGAEIISDFLVLNDKQFLTILQIMSKIFKQLDKTLIPITKKKDRKLIRAKLRYFTTDLLATREFFALVRAVITQRFKPVKSGSDEFKIKTKATRLLLDIFDKALNIEDDVIAIDFDNFLQAIKNWAAHKRDDIEEIFVEFTKNLIVRIEHNLTKSGRKEIKAIITAIMREKTSDFENLLKFGSKYLKGSDFHPDVDALMNY